ncbi:uncharacterized protein [Aquarana catesbeiana]|uniref:uncharacterized protein n=1 Tax=Aquarana catesbeiana TaxID=8400 RepID=UPI003CC93E4A
MIYGNEMADQVGNYSPFPSAPSAQHYSNSIPPPLLPNPPPIYEMPIYVTDSSEYPCDNPLKHEVVTTQPTTMALAQPAFRDYFIWSIWTLVFCNIIFGIVATVFSCKTRDSVKSGDFVSAASSSRKALIFNLTAFVLGIILHIAWIAVVIHQSVAAPVPVPLFTDNSHIDSSTQEYTTLGEYRLAAFYSARAFRWNVTSCVFGIFIHITWIAIVGSVSH